MAGDDADKDVTDEIGEDIPESEEVMQQESDGNDADQEIDTELDGLIQEAVAAALAEQQDSVLRSQAEVQNMRRRCEQDVERAHKFALEKFSSDLLPVMDNLERALQAVPNAEDESVSALYEGVELTLKGFLETLTKYSLEQLDPEG